MIDNDIDRYMNTLGNKKLELFDTGAGASEPIAEENVQLASGQIFFPSNLLLYICVCVCGGGNSLAYF